jgi:hypothetical protein
MSLADIFDQVQNNPETKVDPKWIDNWLASIGNKDDTYHYLENKTTESTHQDKHKVLKQFAEVDKWTKSLYMYRLINDLQDLKLGSYIRWIRPHENGSYTLTNGGILVQTKFLKNGTYVVCKSGTKMMQYELDKCRTFQKLTAEEWIVLMANSHSSSSSSSDLPTTIV